MIRVNDDWVIKEDGLNYMPCRDLHKMVTDKRGDEVREVPGYGDPIGYFQTLAHALEAIIRAEIPRSGGLDSEVSLRDYVARIERTYADAMAELRDLFPEDARYKL